MNQVPESVQAAISLTAAGIFYVIIIRVLQQHRDFRPIGIMMIAALTAVIVFGWLVAPVGVT